MTQLDHQTTAREKLRAAGVPDDQIPALLERATALVAGLEQLAKLDARLPEPALTWWPLDEVTP